MKSVLIFVVVLSVPLTEVLCNYPTTYGPIFCRIPPCNKYEELIELPFGCGYCRPRKSKYIIYNQVVIKNYNIHFCVNRIFGCFRNNTIYN